MKRQVLRRLGTVSHFPYYNRNLPFQGKAVKAQSKGFTDQNKSWLKPKAAALEPAEPLVNDDDSDDGKGQLFGLHSVRPRFVSVVISLPVYSHGVLPCRCHGR